MPAPAGGAGVPSGPAPIVSTAKPSPSPTSTPPFGALHAPLLHSLSHIYQSEGSWLVDKSYIGGPIDCGTTPAKWGVTMKADLRAGSTSEKAYFQEKDAFSQPTLIGFLPETRDRACINFIVNVGHYAGDKAGSAFFITARHNLGGPLACIAFIGGTVAAGEVGVSSSGAPVLNPDQCAALPVFVPVTSFSPEIVRPAINAPQAPNGQAGAAVAPALLKAATPYDLNLTNDLATCTQHTGDQNGCASLIFNSQAIMVWAAGTSCGTWKFCATHVAGFHIYNVPRGMSKTSMPPPNNAVLSPPSINNVASTVQATPTPNPALSPMQPLMKRVLVATVTNSDHKGGIATAGGVYASYVKPGQCFVVVAYLQSGDESDDSPQYCVAGPVKVGPLVLDLTPSALVTAYGHGTGCTSAPPFAHPSGSVLVGYSVTQGTNDNPSGYRCRQNEGLLKFDLSGIALLMQASLSYTKLQLYKSDGSIYSGSGECPSSFYPSKDSWAASDPLAGLVNVGSEIPSTYHSVDMTAAVKDILQSGVNNGFVMRTTDWNGPGSNCFTAFGDFHLSGIAIGH